MLKSFNFTYDCTWSETGVRWFSENFHDFAWKKHEKKWGAWKRCNKKIRENKKWKNCENENEKIQWSELENLKIKDWGIDERIAL